MHIDILDILMMLHREGIFDLVNGSVEFLDANSGDLAPVVLDPLTATNLPNPAIIDSTGRLHQIYLKDGIKYLIYIRDKEGKIFARGDVDLKKIRNKPSKAL